jgi:hypothetical protein
VQFTWELNPSKPRAFWFGIQSGACCFGKV